MVNDGHSSEDDSQSASGNEAQTVEMFSCRKCPGKLFTIAEKGPHQRMHKEEKTRKKTRGARDTSPTASGVTLFSPVNSQSSPSQAPSTSQQSQQGGQQGQPRRGQLNVGRRGGRGNGGGRPLIGPKSVKERRLAEMNSSNNGPTPTTSRRLTNRERDGESGSNEENDDGPSNRRRSNEDGGGTKRTREASAGSPKTKKRIKSVKRRHENVTYDTTTGG